jgi:putative SOS response-associated peptidase YedK
MCGRYSRAKRIDDLAKRFRLDVIEAEDGPPHWNIAPSQEVLVILLRDGKRVLTRMKWGLVPSWAKDAAPGPINARAETLAVKPMFRRLLKTSRCLVPADGFYEWKKVPGQKSKVPYRIALKDDGLFAFAGLWDCWVGPDGKELRTFAIVTSAPNEAVKPVHDRMPVMLTEQGEGEWLEGKEAQEALPAGALKVYPVSTLVNAPANDVSSCATPLVAVS